MMMIDTDISCWMKPAKFMVTADRNLRRLPTCARNSVAFSQRPCSTPSAPRVLMVSKPTRLSTRWALRCDEARKVVSVSSCIWPCTVNASSSISRIATSGGNTIHGEIQKITNTNSSANGTSTSVVTVAEAMKSRTVSKARRLAAKAPTEAGRASMRMPSTRSMISADSITSTRLLARSIR